MVFIHSSRPPLVTYYFGNHSSSSIPLNSFLATVQIYFVCISRLIDWPLNSTCQIYKVAYAVPVTYSSASGSLECSVDSDAPLKPLLSSITSSVHGETCDITNLKRVLLLFARHLFFSSPPERFEKVNSTSFQPYHRSKCSLSIEELDLLALGYLRRRLDESRPPQNSTVSTAFRPRAFLSEISRGSGPSHCAI